MNPKRILLVDDDPDIRLASRLPLESAGYQVFEAVSFSDGQGAVKKIKPDLVILDVMMDTTTAGFQFALDLHNTRISARDYGYSCATRTLVYRGKQVCAGPALQKCLGCSADLYGAPKGWLAALRVIMGRALLKHKVRGIHSISAYVQAIMRRDFHGDQRTSAIAEAIIPSFREDGMLINMATMMLKSKAISIGCRPRSLSCTLARCDG